MANEEILLERCITKLDSMSQGSLDNRPKSVEKLKNTLKHETQVLYLNKILVHLLTLNSNVALKKEEVIQKTDKELDKEIAETVLKLAADQGRQVLVLPCDSDLHDQVRGAVAEWYKREPRIVDEDNPVLHIASACVVNTHLNIEKIISQLETLGFVHRWQDLISFKLPDEAAFMQLQTVWEQWMSKISTDLARISVCTYQYFSALLMNANTEIQNSKIEEIRKYCEEMYVTKYPSYKSRRRLFDTMEIATENNDCSGEAMSPVPPTEKRAKLLNSPLYLWPISLEPEVVFVIVKLMQAEKKPETIHDLTHFLRNVSDVAYVTSPKYILSEIAKDKNETSESGDVVLNVRLGSVFSKKPFSLKDTGAVAAVLCYPGKEKPFRGKSFKHLQRSFNRMDTSTDRSKETFEGFQDYILKTAKHLAQRTGAVLLFDDRAANLRCRDKLLEYLTTLNTDDVFVTPDDFSRKLVQISNEFTTIPAEGLVEILMKAGYLSVNESDMSVTYTQGYRKSKKVDACAKEANFQQEWKNFYKQTEEASGMEISFTYEGNEGMKRKIQMPKFGFFKKQKVMDI